MELAESVVTPLKECSGYLFEDGELYEDKQESASFPRGILIVQKHDPTIPARRNEKYTSPGAGSELGTNHTR